MDCNLIRYPNKETDKARIYLSKNDYLKISEYIESLIEEKFSMQEPAKSKISYSHDGFEATYNTEEFIKNFSTSTKFMELKISAHVPFQRGMIMFHTDSNNFGGIYVYMQSDRHTQVELEDALDALIAYVESLIIPHIQKNNQPSTSLPKQENNQIQQNHVTDTCNPANTSSNPDIPFYKNGVFWGAVGALAGIGGLIIAAIQFF